MTIKCTCCSNRYIYDCSKAGFLVKIGIADVCCPFCGAEAEFYGRIEKTQYGGGITTG